MNTTINQRILKNLESGSKKYSELLRFEENSVLGYKKYLKRKIIENKNFVKNNKFSQETIKSLELINFAYEEFIKEFPDNGSIIEFRSKLNGKVGHTKQDFELRSIRIGFGTNIRNLLKAGKIIKIKRGLYKLSD